MAAKERQLDRRDAIVEPAARAAALADCGVSEELGFDPGPTSTIKEDQS